LIPGFRLGFFNEYAEIFGKNNMDAQNSNPLLVCENENGGMLMIALSIKIIFNDILLSVINSKKGFLLLANSLYI
jgi:hypothetical protein